MTQILYLSEIFATARDPDQFNELFVNKTKILAYVYLVSRDTNDGLLLMKSIKISLYQYIAIYSISIVSHIENVALRGHRLGYRLG